MKKLIGALVAFGAFVGTLIAIYAFLGGLMIAFDFDPQGVFGQILATALAAGMLGISALVAIRARRNYLNREKNSIPTNGTD